MALDPAWVKFGAFMAYFVMAILVCLGILALLGIGLLVKKAAVKLLGNSSREVSRSKVQRS